MKKLLRKGNWRITLALAVAGMGYLYFVFLPAKEEIRQLHQQLRSQQDQVIATQPMKISIYETQEEIDQLREYVAGNHQTHAADAASALAEISDQVQLAGLHSVNFDPQTTTTYRTLRKTPLVLGTEGSFSQIFQFLAHVEQLGARIWLEEFRIESPSEVGKPLSSEITLAIFAFNPDSSD